jgi:HEAT repeat protein
MKAAVLANLVLLGLTAASLNARDERVEQLINTFEKETFTDHEGPEEAKEALIQIGAAAVPDLFRHLDDANLNVRIWTEASLRQMASYYADRTDSPLTPHQPLLRLVKDTEADIAKRNLAVALLGTLQHRGTMEELLPFLTETGLKLSVIRALGTVGDWTAIPPLIAEARDSDPKIRCAVVETVSKIENEKQSGTRNRSVFLQHMLQDSDPSVRGAVISAFYRLRDSSSIPSLLEVMASDPNEDVQQQARMLIAYFITREE